MKQCGLFLLCALAAADATLGAQPTQPIYVQYDGFVRNKNGTLTLSFGYFNMNNIDVTVPPGDANLFTPAPADRNQPVTFLKGRHRFACSMLVDGAFDGKLQWTVKFAGRTEITTAKTLNPLYELELNSEKRAIAGLDPAAAAKNVCVNRAPVVELVNPFGGPDASTNVAAKVGQEAAINGRVDDDGLPRGGKVTSEWKKLSGPGNVTFSNTASGPTRATFSAPGAYVIELSATDGEKTNALKVNVTVS
jgi:K319-like protein